MIRLPYLQVMVLKYVLRLYLYFKAVIAEVQRHSLVAPGTLIHKTLEPTRIGKFSFPKGSLFLVNIAAIMMDPANFEDPETFNPERFLDTDGR